MEFDSRKQHYILNSDDINALGSSDNGFFWAEEPVEQTQAIWDRANQERALNASRDLSEFPAGARRNSELNAMHNTEAVLKGILRVVNPQLKVPIQDIEAFLKDQPR